MGAVKESLARYHKDIRGSFEDQLRIFSPALSSVIGKRDEMLRQWWELYAGCLADERSLSETEFSETANASLDTLRNVYLTGNMERFQGEVRNRWRNLAKRGLPFTEAMVIGHLFEESALSAVPELRYDVQAGRFLRRYVYQCVPLMADAYLKAMPAALATEAASPEPSTNGEVFHGLVGSSAPMRRLYKQIEAVGRSGSTALVIGETGTGKELVARAIHECSPHPNAPFVAINCAALPGHLIESELFGHVRGSFTGADADALGLFRAADGGTLFLDEITEMGAAAQARLLRALQERAVRPVGSLKEIPVNVRVIASTNRDPREAIRQRLLREDLYYRLNVAALHVVPLRDRRDDIEVLVRHFIETLPANLTRHVRVTEVSVQAMDAMRCYAWPGNVRELMNAISSALTFGKSETIKLDDLPEAISGRPVENSTDVMSICDAERQMVIRSLEASGGNVSAAARLLGISRKKLYARIFRYGLSR